MAKSNKRNSSSTNSGTVGTNNTAIQIPRLWCIRSTLTLLVLSVTALSLYFSYSLTTLYSQVQGDKVVIESLQSQVKDQAKIINRFNSSVSNADVEKHLQDLELNVQQAETDMKNSLDSTTNSIHVLLNTTVDQLDATVK